MEPLGLLGYSLSYGPADMDVDTIHVFLSNSYWAPQIPRDVVEKAIAHSRCVGIFYENEQIAFARAVTDNATFAYVADVFVLPVHRNKGLGKLLMRKLLALPELQGLRRILLATADAHDLYKQFGFESVVAPQNMMEIWNPDVYKAAEKSER